MDQSRSNEQLQKEVAERRQAEEALRKSEELYRFLAENTNDIITLYDIEGNRLYVSPSFQRLLGHVPAQTFGGLHPEDLPLVKQSWQQILTGEKALVTFRHAHADGSWRWLEAEGSLVHFQDKPHVMVVTRDVTERKQVEDEGRRQKEILQKIFNNVPITISFYDETGRLVLVNREYERTFGWTVRELDEKNLDVFVEAFPDPTERQRVLEFLGAATGEWTYFKVKAKDGRLIEVWGAVVRASDGTSIAIGQDITERESLKEQLHQAQKMEAVGQLAGGVAHDFNNLLTVINGYCEVALRKLQKGDPLYHNIEEIHRAGERAAMLTRQLLAFSRKQVLQPKVLDLNSVVSEMEKMLGRIIGENIELQISLEPELGSVKADPGQIEQVIMNLAVNARDAMPAGGKLIIETKNIYLDEIYAASHIAVKPGFYIMMTVSDTGIGMDEQIQSHIFEPFFTTKELGKGTGLGLSTVYGIVKQSGGDIRAYSELGRGTTFKIYFPRVGEDAQEYKKNIEPEQPVQGSETILLAEDDEMVRELTREILEMYGYQVLEAANGGAALLICERHEGEIHLLLTDVIMPEMSGRELASRLTQLRPRMKVLYMSGYTDNIIVHHGVVDAGIAFLEKPFTADDLARKIRQVLETD